MKKEINSLEAPNAIGPYSQGIEMGSLVFVSGQLPINPKDGTIPQSVEEQTKMCLINITSILKEAGLTMDNIVKCGIFVKNMDDFTKINSVYETFFQKPFPARFVVEVARLPKDAGVEIDAIACK